jgi:CP family cyanate transporter-like MFS transporter
MALSVAIVQPAVAVVVRAWFPDAVQQVSTAYATSLGVGGLAGAALSVHLMAFGGWRATFVVWALPALLAGMLWLLAAPGRDDAHEPEPGDFAAVVKDRAVWHVAALFGCQSLVYYGSATWIPFQLRQYGAGYLTLVLFVLNFANLPLGFLLVSLRRPWARSRAFYGLSGALMTLGAAGFVLGFTQLAWLWAALLSVAVGMTFSGATALPALFAMSPRQVAGFAAVVLTAGYAISFFGPLAGGVLVDHTHVLASPFWVMAASAVGLVLLAVSLPRRPVPEERPASAVDAGQ